MKNNKIEVQIDDLIFKYDNDENSREAAIKKWLEIETRCGILGLNNLCHCAEYIGQCILEGLNKIYYPYVLIASELEMLEKIDKPQEIKVTLTDKVFQYNTRKEALSQIDKLGNEIFLEELKKWYFEQFGEIPENESDIFSTYIDTYIGNSDFLKVNRPPILYSLEDAYELILNGSNYVVL